jgi:hypothetical protein
MHVHPNGLEGILVCQVLRDSLPLLTENLALPSHDICLNCVWCCVYLCLIPTGSLRLRSFLTSGRVSQGNVNCVGVFVCVCVCVGGEGNSSQFSAI